jgi:hypothetical protein
MNDAASTDHFFARIKEKLNPISEIKFLMVSSIILEKGNRAKLLTDIIAMWRALGRETRPETYDSQSDRELDRVRGQLEAVCHERGVDLNAINSRAYDEPAKPGHKTTEKFVMLREDVLLQREYTVAGETKRLLPSATVLYALLLMHARIKDFCFPSEGTLADEMGLKPRQVRNLVNMLVEAKLITVERDPKHPLNNQYKLHRQVTRQ